jgi:hypothetical protein
MNSEMHEVPGHNNKQPFNSKLYHRGATIFIVYSLFEDRLLDQSNLAYILVPMHTAIFGWLGSDMLASIHARSYQFSIKKSKLYELGVAREVAKQ